MTVRARLFLGTALLLASACSRGAAPNESARQAQTAACVKAGDRCEFSPGKIGLCTAKPEGCSDGVCLTCVSLH